VGGCEKDFLEVQIGIKGGESGKTSGGKGGMSG